MGESFFIRTLVSASLLVLATFIVGPLYAQEFTNIKIEKEYEPFLLKNPLLMDFTGCKIIRLKNGDAILLSVASTTLNDNSSSERIRAEKVCRIKALAAIVAEKNGVQVFRAESLIDKTEIKLENGVESANSITEVLEITKTKVQGITKDVPLIGTWLSKGGDQFYLALGKRIKKETLESSK
jgi:hypothetical protein